MEVDRNEDGSLLVKEGREVKNNGHGYSSDVCKDGNTKVYGDDAEGGVGCGGDDDDVYSDEEGGDEESDAGDDEEGDDDEGEVSDDDNSNDREDDDDLTWSPEFIDSAYKEHLDDNDKSEKKKRYM